MHYLYGSKPATAWRLVATFDSEEQLRAYVRWATLKRNEDGTCRFEQGSPLASYTHYVYTAAPLSQEDIAQVVHNPSPSML
jgi:hypothetical protein